MRASPSAGNARLQPGSSPSSSPWHSRGYLPHFESPESIQHVTYHLADSLPADALSRLEVELRAAPTCWREMERRRRIEDWVDAGFGSCLLRDPEAARLVEEAFLNFDRDRYRLLAWVVMPNHVHVLIQVPPEWSVTRIVASWKSFTGRRLARLAGGTPTRIWHREYWDRFIRDSQHFADVKDYIHGNPVKAGLVARAAEWRWGSARLEPGVPG